MAGVWPRREVTKSRAAAVVGAGEIRRDQIVEPVVWPVLVRASEPAGRDERRDRAKGLDRCGEGRIDLLAPPDVAFRHVARRTELACDLREPLLLTCEQGDRSAVGGHAPCDRAPDACAGTRNDYVLLSHDLIRSSQFAGICARRRLHDICLQRRLPLRRARDASRTKPPRGRPRKRPVRRRWTKAPPLGAFSCSLRFA